MIVLIRTVIVSSFLWQIFLSYVIVNQTFYVIYYDNCHKKFVFLKKKNLSIFVLLWICDMYFLGYSDQVHILLIFLVHRYLMFLIKWFMTINSYIEETLCAFSM